MTIFDFVSRLIDSIELRFFYLSHFDKFISMNVLRILCVDAAFFR